MKPEPKFEIEQTRMSTFWLQRKDGKYDGLHFMDDFGNMWNSISANLPLLLATETSNEIDNLP